jgi:hypothetical protein
MGLDGKLRVDAITTDILYAAGKEKLDMESLTNRTKLFAFMDQLKENGVGPEGQGGETVTATNISGKIMEKTLT